MTGKELMYLEDALGHEQAFSQQFRSTAEQIRDPKLKACVQEMAQKHAQIFQSFYELL